MELDWFVHSAAPEFLICTKCYVDQIYNTQFRSTFRLVHLSSQAPRKCSFSSRRIKDALWLAAVSSSNLSNVVSFMQKRQAIPHCRGLAIQAGIWYTSPDIPNSTFCPACYEDSLMSCSFGSNFHPIASSEAFCDGSTVYIKRMLELYAPTNSWSAFAEQTRARLQLS